MRTSEQIEQRQKALKEKNLGISLVPVSIPGEQRIRVKQIASEWSMSTDSVQGIFLEALRRNEPGVMATTGPKARGKVNRKTLYITLSARDRMCQKLSCAS